MDPSDNQGISTEFLQNTSRLNSVLSKGVEPDRMLALHKITGPTSESRWFYSPLSLVSKDGGWRPIIIEMAELIPDYITLQDGEYSQPEGCPGERQNLTVPIHTPHSKYIYLRFLCRGTNYQFKVLLFDLSIVPRTFTKIMRPVMEKLREQELRLIDDILLMVNSPGKLRFHACSQLINLLQDLWFTLNTKKCVLEHSQQINFLVDSHIMKLSLPQEMLEKECLSMLKRNHSSARDLAHLIR